MRWQNQRVHLEDPSPRGRWDVNIRLPALSPAWSTSNSNRQRFGFSGMNSTNLVASFHQSTNALRPWYPETEHSLAAVSDLTTTGIRSMAHEQPGRQLSPFVAGEWTEPSLDHDPRSFRQHPASLSWIDSSSCRIPARHESCSQGRCDLSLLPTYMTLGRAA